MQNLIELLIVISWLFCLWGQSQVTLLLKMADQIKREKSITLAHLWSIVTRPQYVYYIVRCRKITAWYTYIHNQCNLSFNIRKNIILTSDWELGQCSWFKQSHPNTHIFRTQYTSEKHLRLPLCKYKIVSQRISLFSLLFVSRKISTFSHKKLYAVIDTIPYKDCYVTANARTPSTHVRLGLCIGKA